MFLKHLIRNGKTLSKKDLIESYTNSREFKNIGNYQKQTYEFISIAFEFTQLYFNISRSI